MAKRLVTKGQAAKERIVAVLAKLLDDATMARIMDDLLTAEADAGLDDAEARAAMWLLDELIEQRPAAQAMVVAEEGV